MIENTYEKILEAKQGNKEAMESLVKNNLGLVYNIAKRFAGRGYEQDDLNQIGAMGLVKSIKKFDTSYNVQLSTFSVPYIIGEIKRYIRDDGSIKVSRSIKELGAKINEVQKEYLRKNGEEIKIEKIAEILNVSKEEIALALDANSSNLVMSINEPIQNGSSSKTASLEELIPDNQSQEAKLAERLTLNKLIEELGEQEKKIVILRYFKEQTQSEVAKKTWDKSGAGFKNRKENINIDEEQTGMKGMYFSMKKIILLLISIVLITFCLPIIFTKRFQVVVATNVIDDVNNVVNSGVTETGEDNKTSEQGVTNQESMNPEEVNQEAVKDPEYNYGNYTKVKLLHQKDGSVEEINLDEYMLGVVSAEMPADFEQEALKAQALVARSYTIYCLEHSTRKT